MISEEKRLPQGSLFLFGARAQTILQPMNTFISMFLREKSYPVAICEKYHIIYMHMYWGAHYGSA